MSRWIARLHVDLGAPHLSRIAQGLSLIEVSLAAEHTAALKQNRKALKIPTRSVRHHRALVWLVTEMA
jgi:hypothetical protein